jgi:hypothetical protein
MPIEPEELVGLSEIAEIAGVSRSAVANWRARFRDFPKPVAELQSGPVFLRLEVRKWMRKRRVPMTNVIATINLKGGVSKSTTTVAVAEMLSAEFRKKVLVIDLDPQEIGSGNWCGNWGNWCRFMISRSPGHTEHTGLFLGKLVSLHDFQEPRNGEGLSQWRGVEADISTPSADASALA